jgi:hypothetical protein
MRAADGDDAVGDHGGMEMKESVVAAILVKRRSVAGVGDDVLRR